MKKIILGTAQFGQSYGINNLGQRMHASEIESIIDFSKSNKINFIDTAISYGEAEKNIGKIGVQGFNVISKLPKIPNNLTDVGAWIVEQIIGSLKRLKINTIYGLLLHHPMDLIGPYSDILIKTLTNLKFFGLISKVGVSIYDPRELDIIFPLLKIDIVQSPLNLIDRRLETSGWLLRLHNENVEVHVRSVFLQGLLLMQRSNIPQEFEKWSELWDKWSYILDKSNLSATYICLNYPLLLPEVDCIIVGVDNREQLKTIFTEFNKKHEKKDLSFMINNDEMLINPQNWNKL